MEDKRAHERIDSLEAVMSDHMKEHAELSRSIVENTTLTKEISTNTAELVALVKGIKGFRSFVLWVAPLAAALIAAWAYLKGQAS